MIVVEGGDARDARLEMSGCGAVSCTNFEIAQGRTAEEPRKQLASGEVTPERRGADKVFGCVHGKRFSLAQDRRGIPRFADPARNDGLILAANADEIRVDFVYLPK